MIAANSIEDFIIDNVVDLESPEKYGIFDNHDKFFSVLSLSRPSLMFLSDYYH